MPRKKIPVSCKSVFQNGDSISKERFTKIWVELTNQPTEPKQTEPSEEQK